MGTSDVRCKSKGKHKRIFVHEDSIMQFLHPLDIIHN